MILSIWFEGSSRTRAGSAFRRNVGRFASYDYSRRGWPSERSACQFVTAHRQERLPSRLLFVEHKWLSTSGCRPMAAPGPSEIARRLGYNDSWFVAGVIDEPSSRAQWVTWLRGEERNTEQGANKAVRNQAAQRRGCGDEPLRPVGSSGFTLDY